MVTVCLKPALFGLVLMYSIGSAGQPKRLNEAPSVSVTNVFDNYFSNCGVTGSVTVFDLHKNIITTSDSTDFKIETLPASTFKIVNLLIALETGVIRNVDEVVKWPGQMDTAKYGYRPEIYHDMSVSDAFRESAAWVFVELAKKIGRTRYADYLGRCGYGNGDLSIEDPDFWNQGDFGVSPFHQVKLLRGLYSETLPFKVENMRTVKKVMTVEETEKYVMRGKTGWTRHGGMNTGWWVGMVETNKGVFVFCTRLIQDRRFKRNDFGSCRKSITNSVLKDMGVFQE